MCLNSITISLSRTMSFPLNKWVRLRFLDLSLYNCMSSSAFSDWLLNLATSYWLACLFLSYAFCYLFNLDRVWELSSVVTLGIPPTCSTPPSILASLPVIEMMTCQTFSSLQTLAGLLLACNKFTEPLRYYRLWNNSFVSVVSNEVFVSHWILRAFHKFRFWDLIA